MPKLKSDSSSIEVGTRFKIIVGSLAVLLNGFVFTWYFFYSGLT
ncbi:hypothetical protein [Prochlorococcus sp. MIT 1223]|nr:hypothetical protein [Prochlorococcus sp. MIT 1223]